MPLFFFANCIIDDSSLVREKKKNFNANKNPFARMTSLSHNHPQTKLPHFIVTGRKLRRVVSRFCFIFFSLLQRPVSHQHTHKTKLTKLKRTFVDVRCSLVVLRLLSFYNVSCLSFFLSSISFHFQTFSIWIFYFNFWSNTWI